MNVLFDDFLREGFPIGDLRLAHGAFDAEFRAHAIQRDLEMQLAHAAQNRLTGIPIGFQVE